MKRITLAALALAFLAAAAFAANPGPGPGPEAGPPGHARAIIKMADEIGMTPDQKRFVAQTLKDAKPQFQALREAMKAARENMAAVMDKTPGDEAQVRQAVKAVAKAGEELAVQAGKVKARIDSALTPEQRAKLSEKRAEFKNRMKERFEKGRGELDAWIEQNLKS
jgi:protein CpxP